MRKAAKWHYTTVVLLKSLFYRGNVVVIFRQVKQQSMSKVMGSISQVSMDKSYVYLQCKRKSLRIKIFVKLIHENVKDYRFKPYKGWHYDIMTQSNAKFLK